MRGLMIVVGSACASQAGAQTVGSVAAIDTQPADEAPDRAGAKLELSASPSLGSSLRDDASSATIDEGEYEGSLSGWTALNKSGGLRAQVKAGMTYSPQYFNDDDRESGAYGEIQVGDTYVSPTRIVHGDFVEAPSTEPAVRPYARFRYTAVYRDFLGSHTRDDRQGTLGLRYRRVPYTLKGKPDTAGFYFDVTGELNRVWSTDADESLWNPKIQVNFYGRPLWGSIRMIGTATFEGQIYDRAYVSTGDNRTDWRLRLTGGVDASDLASRVLHRDVEFLLLARLQQRWSNLPDGGQLRIYAVPSATLTIPFRKR